MKSPSKTNQTPLEHEEQVGFVNWFRQNFPSVLIFAIPNGEHRAITVAKRLRSEGVVKGIPDLFIPEWLLWVEMKRQRGGRLSSDQSNVIEHLVNSGHDVIIGLGAKDASRKVLEFIEEGRKT